MMRILVITGLTAIYVMAIGSLAWEDIVLGFAVSSLLLWLYRSRTVKEHEQSTSDTVRMLIQTPKYLLVVAWDVILGTWQVATYVLHLKQLDHPGIIRIYYDEESKIRLGVALWAISVSPGSFVIDVNDEEHYILAHLIDISDPDRVRADLHRKYLHVPGSHVDDEGVREHA